MKRTALACLVLLLASGLAAQDARERWVLAVLRSDGVMLPFASYDGDDWSTPWPVPNLRQDSFEWPVDVDAISDRWWGGKRPVEWTLWDPANERKVPVKPVAPIRLFVGDALRVGIRTDFKPAEMPPSPRLVPYPKEGLVIGGSATLAPIASVSRLAPNFARFAVTLQADINAAEKEMINELRRNARWAHPFADTVRAAVPVQLEAWYTATLPQPGYQVSYIEAVKKYPLLPEDEGCGLETFVRGWVLQDSRVPKPETELTANVVYCDRKGVTYMLPFGQMRLRGRLQWIFQTSGRDNEWYAVAEMTPRRVRVLAQYNGGWTFEPPR
jgi:hypothetical protein